MESLWKVRAKRPRGKDAEAVLHASPPPPRGSSRRARSGGRARARPRRACRCRRRSRGTSRPRATTPARSAAGRRAASGSGSRSSPCRSGETIVCHQTSVGSLPRAAFSAVDEPRRHVRLAVDRLGVEVVALRILDVDEDRVVLRRPAPLRARAVVVGPDDLVQEALAAEDLVEQHLAVVHLAVVDVEVERAVAAPAPVAPRAAAARGSRGSRRSCRGSAARVAHRCAVAPAAEAGAVAVVVGGSSRA